jgi:hypothetical protein
LGGEVHPLRLLIDHCYDKVSLDLSANILLSLDVWYWHWSATLTLSPRRKLGR